MYRRDGVVLQSELSVRAELKDKFGQPFSERQLPIGFNAQREEAFKKFDAVSDDGKIIAMVKDLSSGNERGNQTRLARVMWDLLLLHMAEADHKFMYLSHSFFQWFKGQSDAAVPRDVEVRLIRS